MNENIEDRFLAAKVGVFVMIGLVMITGLMLNFSKGASIFDKTYPIILETSDVGGLIEGAKVLMSGVPVGTVASTDLSEDGSLVKVRLNIFSIYNIKSNSKIFIEQSGFLGDQQVAIYPQPAESPNLKPDEVVRSQAPFSIQKTARSVTAFLSRAESILVPIEESAIRLNEILLTEESLGDLRISLRNLRKASDTAVNSIEEIEALIQSNAPRISNLVTNLSKFSNTINKISSELQRLIETNGYKMKQMMGNLNRASERIDGVLIDIHSGQGTVGRLLYDEETANQFSLVVSNLSLLSSNLTRFGLFWKPKKGSSIFFRKNRNLPKNPNR